MAACVLRGKGGQERERMRPGDGERERGGGRERKHCCDAGTQSGASNSLPSNAGRWWGGNGQNLSIITKTGKDWDKIDN